MPVRRRASFRPLAALYCLIAAFCCAPGLSQAHPFHSSYAEIEWSETGGLDVALRVIPEDLERALSLRAGRNVVLVDEPSVRELLVSYLAEHFRLLPGDDQSEPRLVGMQLDYRETWIYFSLSAPQGADAALHNPLLMDLEPTQTNRVRRLWDPEAPVMVFSAAEPRRPLAVPEK